MSSAGSFRIRDGSNTLLVRRGDVLQSTFEVGAIGSQSTAILNNEGRMRFYLVHFRLTSQGSGGNFTFRVSEANAAGVAVGPNLVVMNNTAPVAKTGSISDWLSFEPILNDLAIFRRVTFKVYTTRKIIFYGTRNYEQFGSLEYPTITYRGGPDRSGLALVRLGSISTGRLFERFVNPSAAFSRGGIPGKRLVVILTQITNAAKIITMSLVPPPSGISNQFYSLGEINLVDAGQEITFPSVITAGSNYSGTIYYVDESEEVDSLSAPSSSTTKSAVYIPDLAALTVRETFRLGDMNPTVDSLLAQGTNVANRVVWIRRGLPVF